VSLCAVLLLLGYLLLLGPRPAPLLSTLAVAGLTLACHLWPRPGAGSVTETAYASYRVEPVELPGAVAARALRNNNSYASLIDASEPPRYARYIRRLRELLLEDLAWQERDILVLGAGGFTLSHREPLNRYTYVDIDPAMQRSAEAQFLREPIRGRFIADDARRYVATSSERFDAALVDVYSSHTAIPAHLVTREFWRDTRRVLKPDGLLIANLLLDPALVSPYARNLLATIEQVYGRCAVEVLLRQQPLGNVLVICHASAGPAPTSVYSDELNQADLDLWRSR
jgi:SAM-dependent methyltransferase